jgi:prevent-host-death family protein
MRLGLREANQHFARTIKAVRSGQEVVLTDRGRPIAIIKPIKIEDEDGSQVVALRALAEEGLITLPDRKGPMPAPRWRPVKFRGLPVSRTIIDDREDTA